MPGDVRHDRAEARRHAPRPDRRDASVKPFRGFPGVEPVGLGGAGMEWRGAEFAFIEPLP